MSMMLNPRREAVKEFIEADTDPMKELLWPGATFIPTPTQNKLCCQNRAKEEDHEGDH